MPERGLFRAKGDHDVLSFYQTRSNERRVIMMRKTLLGMFGMAGFVCFIFVFPYAGYGEDQFIETEGMTVISPSKIESFKAALAKKGFEVEEWEDAFGNVNIADLVCKGLMKIGYGNNADAPYMVFKHEVEIPPMGKVKIPRLFQLRPDEAIVFIGRTPPPVAYFSYRSYVIDHIYENALGEKGATRVFTSLGDTLSNRTIKTTGQDPFKRDVVIVITADKGTDARVRAAARSAGIPSRIINTDIIPSSVVRMGIDKDPMPFNGPPKEFDAFVFIHRIFLNEGLEGPGSDYENYLNDPGARVFHLTQDPQTVKLDPFPMPQLLKRGTGSTEVDLMPSLEDLRQAILNKYPGYTATELTTRIWLNEWLDGIQRRENLLGENRDTSYLCSENFTLQDSSDEFLIIYGINHEAWGKATYSNFSVYHDEKKLGIKGMHSRKLAQAHSADDYIPNDPNASYLYAMKVARACSQQEQDDGKCLKIELPETVQPCNLVDLNKDLFVAFRAYVEPKTKVGPYWYELLYDRVIKFSKNK